MPNIIKELEKCKHPNSRKTKAITKKANKVTSRNKNVLAQNLKRTVLATKVKWFQENVDPDCLIYSKEQCKALIERYLLRFNDELEQIVIKHSIGKRKNRQHANREDVIKMTIKRETEEFNTCGTEIPNIMDSAQLQQLKAWDGDLVSLQHLPLIRIKRKQLE